MAELELVSLTFSGKSADGGRLDFYDAAASYEGFARFLSLSAHFYATGKIITKAPYSAARVEILAPERGSFITGILVAVGESAVGGGVGAFIGYVLGRHLPKHDPQMQKLYEEQKETNRLLRKQMGIEPKSWAEIDAEQARREEEFYRRVRPELDTLRSITAPALAKTFRPLGRSADTAVISVGQDRRPVRAVNRHMADMIDADQIDERNIITTGVISDFSQATQKGFYWDDREGRRVRFEFDGYKLEKRNDLSWSLFEQEPLALHGKYVRFLDGSVKKLLVRHTERIQRSEQFEQEPVKPLIL